MFPNWGCSLTYPLLCSARERILTNLKKQDVPQPPVGLVPMRAPVPDISPESLSDLPSSTRLIHEDLSKLQHQAK